MPVHLGIRIALLVPQRVPVVDRVPILDKLLAVPLNAATVGSNAEKMEPLQSVLARFFVKQVPVGVVTMFPRTVMIATRAHSLLRFKLFVESVGGKQTEFRSQLVMLFTSSAESIPRATQLRARRSLSIFVKYAEQRTRR